MAEDDFEFNEAAHSRLISAVTKLDKTQHIKKPIRTEPSNLNSEFNLLKSSNKIDIKDVVKVLENTAHHVQISKRLKKTQDVSKILPKPLEKPQAARVKRSVGYEETKKKVGRWDAVVARSRTVDCVYFPLKRGNNKLQQTKEFLSKFEQKSPLEIELEQVDPPPPQEVEDKEEPVFPQTYQEMLDQRGTLAKLRVKESFKAAKAKRQSKIKSKKFHRILKKERLKKQLQEFEELQKNNPEEALKKLEALEKERALERHTLRHKNTGKWAKSKLVRAKYDKEVREQLAQQLAVSRTLTHHAIQEESTDDEDTAIPDVILSQDTENYCNNFFSFNSNLENPKATDDSDKESENSTSLETEPLVNSVVSTSEYVVTKISDDISKAFDRLEKDMSERVKKKLQKLRNDEKEPNKYDKNQMMVEGRNEKGQKPNFEDNEDFNFDENQINEQDEKDNLEDLLFKTNKKAVIDEKLMETYVQNEDNGPNANLSLNNTIPINNKKAPLSSLSNSIVFKIKKPEFIDSTLPNEQNDCDHLDDDPENDDEYVPSTKLEDACEEHGLVSDFRDEKNKEINKDSAENTVKILPGWGCWGGKGVKAPKRKRNRFITRGAEKMPRRDENKGDIIIKEYRDPKLSSHKLTEIPFPFTSIKEYESSIRAPIGNTFIPENAYRKVIRPSVITKAGTIIEPMDEDELLSSRNKSYKNKSVIDLLAKHKNKS